jgi:hypothetical protein
MSLVDDKKTIKFQIILSEEEAQEIDAWGEALRLRSRAETIRTLCRIGITGKAHLSGDAALPSLVERLEAAVKALEART